MVPVKTHVSSCFGYRSAASKGLLPKSIPITWPLTFSSPPSELYRTKDDDIGERRRPAVRVTEDVARGS